MDSRESTVIYSGESERFSTIMMRDSTKIFSSRKMRRMKDAYEYSLPKDWNYFNIFDFS
jgi:hypothetical protein